MALVFHDEFTDTNGTALNSHTPTDVGTGWSHGGGWGGGADGDLEIQSNEMTTTNSSNNSGTYSIIDDAPGSAEYDVIAQANSVDTSSGSKPWGLVGRWVPGDSDAYCFYIFATTRSPGFELVKVDGGSVTSLGTSSTNYTQGNVCKLEILNATKKCFEGATERISSSDNAVAAAGYGGLGVGSFYNTSYHSRSGWSLDTYKVDAAGPTVHDLVVQEATHGHTADNVVLTAELNLAIAECAHAHAADQCNADIAVTSEMEGFRFRNDDGSESAATWAADQDANFARSKNTPARLRILTNHGGDPPTKTVTLQYRKVGDSEWETIA